MEAYKQEAIEICRDLKYDNTVITKIKNASSECEVQQIMISARHQQTIESNTKNVRVSDRRCNTYIRDICKCLVKYDGNVSMVYLQISKMYYNVKQDDIINIKNKIKYTDISDKYFDKNYFIRINRETTVNRNICKLLVKYDGSIKNTCEELARIFPNVQIPRRRVEKIKYKESNTDISNQYFKKDQFKN